MPYVALEDVDTTRRQSLSGRRRLQAWERTGGICVVCGQHIDGVRERWIVEHIRALELGGADDLENMGPAHEACGREKTRDDHAHAAEAKRRKIRHLGAAVAAARPLTGSRAGALKRKVNGTVVFRETRARALANDELEAGQGRAPRLEPKPFSVDSPIEPADRLCPFHPPSAKENRTGTTNHKGSRATMAKPGKVDGARKDAAASGEILPAIPAHLDFLFDDRPLLPDENEEQYDALLRSIVQQVKPADVIEAIWVKDVVDLIWQAKWLRRYRVQILVQARLKAVEDLILPSFRNSDASGLDLSLAVSTDALAAGWVTGNKSEKGRVDTILHERGLTAADVTAHGFLLNLPAIERIDRLSLAADQRRDALLREIERKRASFAQQVRSATTDVLDVEHTETR